MTSSHSASVQNRSLNISGVEVTLPEPHRKEKIYVKFVLGEESTKTEKDAVKKTESVASFDKEYTISHRHGSALELKVEVYKAALLGSDTLIGVGTHHIQERRESGKVHINIQETNSGAAGEVEFYLKPSQGFFGSSGGAGSGMTSGVGGAGSGMTSGVGGTGAGIAGATGGDRGVAGVHHGAGHHGHESHGVGHGQASEREGRAVCDQEFHTKVEDRPVTKETTTTLREHHPIEKQFVTEVRPTGQERELHDKSHTEVLGSRERVVDVARGDPCSGVPTGNSGAGIGGHSNRTSGTGGMTGTGGVTGNRLSGTGGPTGPAGPSVK